MQNSGVPGGSGPPATHSADVQPRVDIRPSWCPAGPDVHDCGLTRLTALAETSRRPGSCLPVRIRLSDPVPGASHGSMCLWGVAVPETLRCGFCPGLSSLGSLPSWPERGPGGQQARVPTTVSPSWPCPTASLQAVARAWRPAWPSGPQRQPLSGGLSGGRAGHAGAPGPRPARGRWAPPQPPAPGPVAPAFS